MENMIRRYAKGDVIFREGTFEPCMHVLLKGTVGIYKNYGKPEERLLVKLEGGNCSIFGEMGMLESLPRSASAVALNDVQTGVITVSTFGKYFGQDPDLLLAIMRSMSDRIRTLSDDYLEACRTVCEACCGKKCCSQSRVSKFLKDYSYLSADDTEVDSSGYISYIQF